MDATASLARFTHDLRVDDLPASTIDACARLALDTVGAAIPAWEAPGVRELRALLAQMGQGALSRLDRRRAPAAAGRDPGQLGDGARARI